MTKDLNNGPKSINALLGRERYAYFLIWGNGLQYKKEIINLLRNAEFIEILRIMKYRPKSVDHLVNAIYSYDYAPIQHLKGKTQYLLKTKPDAVFIFIRNMDPKERPFGTGAFKHTECERVKQIKEDIRNKFNPRKNGKRTEEHVVHASDNESQVDHILKYLGFKEGINLFKTTPNSVLSVPYYISKFEEFTIRRIKPSQLYCNILRNINGIITPEAIPIGETPHFTCLTGNPKPYKTYLTEFLGGPMTCDYSVDNLMKLSENLRYLSPPHDTSYVLVKECRQNKFLILDGVHRASILKFRKVKSITVAVI